MPSVSKTGPNSGINVFVRATIWRVAGARSVEQL